MSKSLAAWRTPRPSPTNALAMPGELARGRLRRRRCGTARGAVIVGASSRESGSACLEGTSQEIAHRGDVVVRRRFVGDGAIAHHVNPERVVRDLHEEVDGVGLRRDRVHVFGEGLPPPRDALREHRARDVLDAFHQLDELSFVAGPHRGEADTAASHHAGRHAVERARRQVWVPRHLPVVVRVDVDEAGKDVRAPRVDGPGRRSAARADLDDPSALDGDVPTEWLAARAVDQRSPDDLQIEHAFCPALTKK
jgi:hypothetical protein